MIGKRKDGLTSQHCSTCIGHTSLTFFEKAQKQKAIDAPLRAYRDIAMASPSKKWVLQDWGNGIGGKRRSTIDECRGNGRFGIRAGRTHELTKLRRRRKSQLPTFRLYSPNSFRVGLSFLLYLFLYRKKKETTEKKENQDMTHTAMRARVLNWYSNIRLVHVEIIFSDCFSD